MQIPFIINTKHPYSITENGIAMSNYPNLSTSKWRIAVTVYEVKSKFTE